MSEELQHHIELRIEKNIKAGMPADEARISALRVFGGLEQIKERARDERSFVFVEQLLQDLRYAMRQFRRNPGFASIALISLALGIGANTAIFSLVNEVLLKPLPVRNPNELVVFRWHGVEDLDWDFTYFTGEREVDPVAKEMANNGFSLPVFENFRRVQDPLTTLFAFGELPEMNGLIAGQAEAVSSCQTVSGEYFSSLGVSPALGRTIEPSDDQPGAPPVVVLSYSYWKHRFAGDVSVLGKAITLNKVSLTIVGVTPASFRGPQQIGTSVDLSVPLAVAQLFFQNGSTPPLNAPENWWLHVMGRLKPGASYNQVCAQLQGVFLQTLAKVLPSAGQANVVPEHTKTAAVRPYLSVTSGVQGLSEQRHSNRRSLLILIVLVVLVLLIACLNLANLLLARASSRTKEIAMRLALGASRSRLIRQLLTESLLLAFLGAGLGVLLALWSRNLLIALHPVDGSTIAMPLDGRVLVFTTAVAAFAGVIFGLIPALISTKVTLNSEIQGSHRFGRNGSRSALQQTLMSFQIAMSLVLLICAGLFGRTLRNMQGIDLGFEHSHLLLFRIEDTSSDHNVSPNRNLFSRINERLGGFPGVSKATFSRLPIMGDMLWSSYIDVPGYLPPSNDQDHSVAANGVSAAFFKTYQIGMFLGREFTAEDVVSDKKVVIVNRAFALKYFGDENVVGRSTSLGEIIGVVGNSRYDDPKKLEAAIAYLPYNRLEGLGYAEAHFAVRTESDPLAIVPAIRRAINDIDPELPLYDIQTMDDRIRAFARQPLLFASLSSFFGVLVVALVCIGLYGLMSYAVLLRTNEIGVRMALGALPKQVLWMILRESLLIVSFGVILGIAGSLVVARVVSGMLFQLSSTDPLTYMGMAALLIAVTLLASWIPARRAAATVPMRALR
jgi:predicted permease